MRFKSLVLALTAALSASTFAGPVTFAVSNATVSPSAGYGQDVSEAGNRATLLDTRFTTTGFMPQAYTLNSAGDFVSFNFGTVSFLESNNIQGIITAEMDDLDVGAAVVLSGAFNGLLQSTATGTAASGSVSDNAVDYTLNWAPGAFYFGNGGQLSLTFNNLSFSNTGTRNLIGTVTYVSESVEVAEVPEPASIALVGAGLLGLMAARRRKATKA